MKTKGFCWGCNLPIKTGHYHREITVPGQPSCYKLRRAQVFREHGARVRKQGAALNGGKEIGEHCRDVADRFEPLTIRSRATVAKMMGLTVSGIRVIELRAMAKVRRLLMPFRNARSGAEKVTQITKPISC